ncbi:MAG: hypothetical protein ACO3SP_09675, partial [Ilumatobacteraceae bacterium]
DAVQAVTAGPRAAENVLRSALAVGVDEVRRIDLDSGTSSAAVAEYLAPALSDCQWIWCGDYSSNRGSGSVPAFLAGELRYGQALGLISVDLPSVAGSPLVVRRRLDGGRREVLEVRGPAVLSVEGSAARLRRASLRQSMAASKVRIHVNEVDQVADMADHGSLRPFRPRPRVVSAPEGRSALERVRRVTETSSTKGHGEVVELEPRPAAERIMSALRQWQYLDQ